MKLNNRYTRNHTSSFSLENEDGSATILSLFFVLIALVLGGLAIDFNKAISERTQLQITADTAAHAALYTRETKTANEAIATAITTVDQMLPEYQFGRDAMMSTDISFGDWDIEKDTFAENASSNKAVRVRAMMIGERDNASRNILLGMIGQDTFDIGVQSVYTTYYPSCFTEGFVAEEVVDIQSGNTFTDGFCIHSNDYVSLNQNNYFESGTVVSMPTLADLDLPNSGFEANEGLQTALRTGEYRMRLLNQLPDIIDSFWNAEAQHLPPYVVPAYVHNLDLTKYPGLPADAEAPQSSSTSLSPAHFEPNAVNRMNCSGSKKIKMDAGLYSQFVFISDCEVQFSNGVVLEDVVLATTHTGATSLNSAQGLQIGRDDDCAAGGGATLMTMGGFNTPASLSVYNGQILALGDIEFAANADGIQGASFVSYGRIEGTSNMNMGFCKNRGMENAYRAPYFRMVE